MVKYYWGDRIKNEIGGAYGMNGEEEKSTENFAGEKRRKGHLKTLGVYWMVRINWAYKA